MNVVSLDLSVALIPLLFQALPENRNFHKKLLIKSGLSGQKSSLYTISIGGISLPMCAREIAAEGFVLTGAAAFLSAFFPFISASVPHFMASAHS